MGDWEAFLVLEEEPIVMPDRIWYLLSIKLSGEATQAELDEFYILHEQHPELEEAIQHITRYWLQPKETPTFSSAPDWLKHLKRLKASGVEWDEVDSSVADSDVLSVVPITEPAHRIRQMKWWMVAAAVFIISLGAGWLAFIRPSAADEQMVLAKNNKNEFVTRPASRSQLTLPDGSKVWLNASSKLSYESGFGEENRNVWLEGEGFFEVFKNKALPFIIHTSRMNVKVTGTVFNVRAYPQEATSETALIEGSVEVALSGEKEWKYHLKPHQKLVVDEHGLIAENTTKHQPKVFSPAVTVPAFTASLQSLSKPLADQQVVETAWVYNLLSFSDESFRQVTNKMEKWYGVTIRFMEADMENWHFTGSFKDETLAEALTALKVSTAFNFVIQGNTVFISKPYTK